MSKLAKILDRVLRGTSDANIGFEDLCMLLRHLGFDERIRGSHHIFTREGIPEILNLQSRGGQAKPYQVRQVRGVIVGHRLAEIADKLEVAGEPPEQQIETDQESRERQDGQ
jgi:hypothetical protein